MNNRNLVRGLFLIAIALAFGIGATRYPLGHLERAGPGMFPMMASGLLLLLGLLSVMRSFVVERMPIHFNIRNIAIILASLVGFALLSEHLNMIAGIVFLVFVSTIAGTSYSVLRNVKIVLGLVAIAVAFKELLGVQLPLY
ncbi:MAG: tripartite tricarboxylate transporter TctB family protein [Burkholderiales bacterium]